MLALMLAFAFGTVEIAPPPRLKVADAEMRCRAQASLILKAKAANQVRTMIPTEAQVEAARSAMDRKAAEKK